jgi:hypothetical protein
MSNALSPMMAPRPTTPEQLRLKQPAPNSSGPKGAATPDEAHARVWNVSLEKFDKAQFRDQPFSISVRSTVAAHQLACELHSRTSPPIQRVLAGSRRGNPERVESSHLCKTPGCAQLGHTVPEGCYYNSSRNHCNSINCEHDPRCFMPLEVQAVTGHHLSRPPAVEPLSPTKSQLKKENKRLKKELAEALRARETTPPSGRKRGREEESPAMSSAEKRARAMGLFQPGVISSPNM